jgi:hypothetical protein
MWLLNSNRPVDERVPCDRPNRAPEFEGPPIFCSPVACRRAVQAQQVKILADRSCVAETLRPEPPTPEIARR